MVKMLLDKGAHPKVQDMLGWTALMFASMNGHAEVIHALADKSIQMDAQSNDGLTALMIASQNGHTHVIKELITVGANIEVRDNDGWTALMLASFNKHTDVVKMLLNKGASVDTQNTDGWTALFLACQDGCVDIIQLFLDKGEKVDAQSIDGTTALMLASQNGCPDVVNLLLMKGAEVDTRNNEGWTSLMYESQEGNIEVVTSLLEKNNQIDLQNKDELTALMIASCCGHARTVELLLDKNAQVNLQTSDGWSALMIASTVGHLGIVKLLLDRGAQIDLQSCKVGQQTNAKLLLNHGAQVALSDSYTALMLATYYGRREVVKILLKRGAQYDLRNADGKTAADIAKYRRCKRILKLLLKAAEAECRQNLKDEDSEHDRQFAVQDEHLDAIKDAIEYGGILDHTLVQGVFVGLPRSGKDSLMKRLLGERPLHKSPSTGAAEKVIHVKVEKSSTFAAVVEDSGWTRLQYDEEAIHLMKMTSGSTSSNFTGDLSNPDVNAEGPTLPVHNIMSIKEKGGYVVKVQKRRSSKTHNGLQNNCSVSLSSRHITNGLEQETIPNSAAKQKHNNPMEIFKKALKNKGLEGLRKQLEKSWSLYLTNTGGQMEFQELLPLLVSGPSVFFITFPLHRDLEERYLVEYELPNRKSSNTYQSSLSISESILQTLSTIAAMGTFVYKGLQKELVPLRPKVFIIGTHKDMLNDKTAKANIQQIDKHLQMVIKSTSHYREGTIQFASETQMIFSVSNLDSYDSDFQQIRLAVERIVKTGEYKMSSPAQWMIYSLVLRQLQGRVETYNDCFAIAKECGIRDEEEFEEALYFIHTKLGLLRYFPHEVLSKIVIVDPQILFEMVTELIVETFTFENLCNHSRYEDFKQKGIFCIDDFTRINSQTGRKLTPSIFAKLLEHLRIAARFQEGGKIKYFLPCALSHTPEKDSSQTSQCSTIPPLIVTFDCGYCPKGLFGTLITYLIANEMQTDYEWELLTDQIFRDEVSFQVGPYDVITLRFLPAYLEILCCASNSALRRTDCQEEVCKEVWQSLEAGIKTVTSSINYINAKHSFTFYCTSENCRRQPHPSKLKVHKDKMCSLSCDRGGQKQVFPLPQGHEVWQLGTKPLKKLKFELNSGHHASLYFQLSEHSAKWKEIGTYLGFHPGELDNIGASPSLQSEAPKSLMHRMLSEWLEWAPGDHRGSTEGATLEGLKTAVSKAGLGATANSLTTGCMYAATVEAVTTSNEASVGVEICRKRNISKKDSDSDMESKQKRPRLG